MSVKTKEKQTVEAVGSVSVSTDHRPVVPGSTTLSGRVQTGAVTATAPPPEGSVSATPLPEFGAVSTTLPVVKGHA